MFDVFLKSFEFINNFICFYGKNRYIVDVFYRFIGNIYISNGIQSFDDYFRWRYPEIGREKKYVTACNDKECSDEYERKSETILVLFQNIDNGIKIIESFLFLEESKKRNSSSGRFFRIEKIALFLFKRRFLSEFPIFPISGNSLDTILYLSH